MLAENPLFVIVGGTTATPERLGRTGPLLTRRFGGASITHVSDWEANQGIVYKAKQLNQEVSPLAKGADRLVLIGLSAGGDQVLYLSHQILDERTRERTRLALVCTRVAQDPQTPENDAVYGRSPDYEEGVRFAQQIVTMLTEPEMFAITTYSALSDRITPPESAHIIGATNHVDLDPTLDHQAAMGRFFMNRALLERLLH